MVAVDYTPGFEAAFARADPLTRYAAFVRDGLDRRHAREGAGLVDDELSRLLRTEGRRLRGQAPGTWEQARTLLAIAAR
jgi:hypothetical protein